MNYVEEFEAEIKERVDSRSVTGLTNEVLFQSLILEELRAIRALLTPGPILVPESSGVTVEAAVEKPVSKRGRKPKGA